MSALTINLPMSDEEACLLIHILAVTDQRNDEEETMADHLYHRLQIYRREAK